VHQILKKQRFLNFSCEYGNDGRYIRGVFEIPGISCALCHSQFVLQALRSVVEFTMKIKKLKIFGWFILGQTLVLGPAELDNISISNVELSGNFAWYFAWYFYPDKGLV
jgi:hypothetical protein